MGKTAKFLKEFGHDVKVVTISRKKEKHESIIEIDSKDVKSIDIKIFDDVVPKNYFSSNYLKKIFIRIKYALRFRSFSFFLPNSSWSWISKASREATKIVDEWKPDLIFSSALPISSHIIARKVSVKNKIPWIAEYRDLWSGGPGARVGAFESFLLKRIEKKILSSAIGIVTVSEPLADYMKALHMKTVITVYNGYDQYDDSASISIPSEYRDKLLITYTGSLYEGRYPDTLFATLKEYPSLLDEIRIHFYTSDNEVLQKKVKQYGLQGSVRIKDLVSHSESLKIQRKSDILLYLSYSSQSHKGSGILSGKAFEYLGANRPILSVGKDSEHVLIKEGLMHHAKTKKQIYAKLSAWLSEKKQTGMVTCELKSTSRSQYSRKEQTAKIDAFLQFVKNEKAQ